MADNVDLEKELQKLRTQGKVEVSILVSSLLLIFFWMSFLSISTNLPTFSGELYQETGRAMEMSAPAMVNFSFIFAIMFTCFFCILLRIATSKLA